MPERESRLNVLERICTLTGGAIRTIEARKAWPALVDVATGRETFRASLHVGTVGYTHRDLDHVERRYQNPSNLAPIVALPGTRPMLLGLWTQEKTPVLVAHDAVLRQGQGGTRVSLFVGLAALREAASPVGWGEYEGATGERIIACRPSLLPMLAEMLLHAVVPGEGQTHQALVAAGPVTTDPAAFERARRAVSVLIRDATFRKRVVAAYGGQCALCGLGLGLVEGAHIYPASAPNSPDDARNGLALCPNHHAAFDRHLIWIAPQSFQIVLHPLLYEQQAGVAATQFLTSTTPTLLMPQEAAHQPSSDMFSMRYEFFAAAYSWVRDLKRRPR